MTESSSPHTDKYVNALFTMFFIIHRRDFYLQIRLGPLRFLSGGWRSYLGACKHSRERFRFDAYEKVLTRLPFSTQEKMVARLLCCHALIIHKAGTITI